MRMLILSEDYSGELLCMSDCTNEQLQTIIEKALENDENGIGQTVTELVTELFPNNYMVELGCSEQSEYCYLNEVQREYVCGMDYLSFSVVQSSKEL